MLDSIIIHYQYAGIKWLLISSSESLEVKKRIVWKEESLKGNTAFVITGEFPWLSVGEKRAREVAHGSVSKMLTIQAWVWCPVHTWKPGMVVCAHSSSTGDTARILRLISSSRQSTL